MSIINFDLSVSPDPTTVTFGVSVTPTSAIFSLTAHQDLSITAEPGVGVIVGGAIVGTLLGGFIGGGVTVGVIFGIAKAIGDGLSQKVNDLLNDPGSTTYTYDFGAPLGYTLNVEGVDISVQATQLALSTFNDMLMAEGTVDVS